MTTFKRVTLTIDPSLLEQIDHVSVLMGVSRSVFVFQILTEFVGEMYNFLKAVKVSDDPDAACMRGCSADYVQAWVEDLFVTIESDLFKG